jgi:uncharacterized protein
VEKMSDTAVAVVNNEPAHRFEARVDGHLAQLTYRRGEGRITYPHTEVPDALEGRGVGSALARTALDYARAAGLKVVPLCPFVRAYIDRHPEYADLVQ